MKTAKTLVILTSVYFLSFQVLATEVQPTDKDIQYMEKLDKNLENKTGTHMNNVDTKVDIKPDGTRVIHMDYSKNPGAEIKPPKH